MSEALNIHGVGVSLPASRPVVDLATAVGGHVEDYSGWRQVAVGSDADHPGNLASRALRAALAHADIPASEMKFVVSTGLSREYLGSWSCAIEVMRQHDMPSTCIPLDISCGCVATLSALPLVRGLLAAQGGGYAAIVAGERLSDTVDRADNAAPHLWPYGDGGSAIIVGVNTRTPALWQLESTGFSSHAPFAGILRVEYGGTRHPTAPPGSTNYRRFQPVPLAEIRDAYVQGYHNAFTRAFAGTTARPQRVVCNQMSPNFLPAIAEYAGVPLERVVVTGHDHGHVGAADLGIGLRRLIDAGQSDTILALGASTPFAFGAAVLLPAAKR
ncbi:3-oxoacyl-[acyl-carrier-protein] synthase III C-terminal domain-containing protein [Ideonella sp. B508-1]|uniref:3-oxoacyl-[acyl-carrier-protein] synthase III C-terminal domain-containing protein n=1 Tax=Ideonella sp. B508-1 TaxID=137716 RepID=UPI0003B54AF6|nr:3-oxoacyl-[acyl-carrier-protein] synthase III C-terminal domain-containing protein [Ideonella sp. B508-1]